jgi:hypothetical protein
MCIAYYHDMKDKRGAGNAPCGHIGNTIMIKIVVCAAVLVAGSLPALAAKPSKSAIVALQAAPTDMHCVQFDARYGQGSAARYMNVRIK